MTSARLLPAPARLPHDPLLMRLNANERGPLATGVAERVRLDSHGAYALAIKTPAGPGLRDPLGTLGGLIPPPFVAFAPDGAIYLLDRAGHRLLRFDPCACRFKPLPCLIQAGPDPRAIANPLAIAADEALLAVAGATKTGGCVVVMARASLSPRVILNVGGEPNALAFDRYGCLVVADRMSGTLHRFTPAGHERSVFHGVGPVLGLAVDRANGVLVATDTGARRYRFGAGEAEDIETVDEIRATLPQLPFSVDAVGRLALAPLCYANGAQPIGHGLFNARGEPVRDKPAGHPPAVFFKTGRLVTGALDSRIHACQWHRVLLDVDLPAGTQLRVRTRCDEIELGASEAASPTSTAWSSPQIWTESTGAREFLVLSPPGRFAWLEVEFTGTGAATPQLRSLEVEFPRVSLRRYLPAAFAPDPVSADFADRFLAIFDQSLRSIEKRIDGIGYIYDPRTTPDGMLDWLAGWIGLSMRGLTIPDKRRLLRNAPRLYAKRGTLDGLRQLLLLHLGLDRLDCPKTPQRCGPTCGLPPTRRPDPPMLILEHWRLRRWLFLGHGRLGEGSRLWGESILNRSRLGENMQLGVTQAKLERDPLRDPFHAHAHAFSVFLPATRAQTLAQRRRLELLIAQEAPAHTRAVVHWVEPTMRLGIQSTLGFDAVLGTPEPRPVVLDQSRLGRGTTLATDPTRGPGVTLGRDPRLGRTTHFSWRSS